MSQPSVVVIGNFDGVHKGHQAVLARARELEPDALLVALTFWPHPVSVVRPGAEPLLITPLDERCNLLSDAGADEVAVLHFTKEMASWSPEEFVDKNLRPLNPIRVVVGENFRFGRKAEGSVETLRELGRGSFEVVGLPLVMMDSMTTCSTEIRRLIAEGDVAAASHHLGRWFRFSGTVVVGHKRGRDLGFPTANLPVPARRVAPADGVYAGWARREDCEHAEMWPAAISVGTNPTFDDVPERVVEAHILDRNDLELYGVPISVDFVDRLRGNVKYESIEKLVDQIGEDVRRTREILGLPESD